MKILKFGGSSIGTTARIQTAIDIIAQSKEEHGDIAVVVSALQNVTNQLIEAGQHAFRGNDSYEDIINELEIRHITIADKLLGSDGVSNSHKFIAQAFKDLREFLRGIRILGELTNLYARLCHELR